jgi:hypothetical protein
MLVDPERPTLHICNYGQVLSIWDVLFGTSLYGMAPRPTGVGDPVVDADNDHGLVGLHWAALKRFWGAVRCIEGWRPGEVAFGEGYRPIPVSQLDLHAFEHKPPASPAVEVDLASNSTSAEVA